MRLNLFFVQFGIILLIRHGSLFKQYQINIKNSLSYFLLIYIVKSSYYEEQLFKELFQNYNPLIRPVRKLEETITISFSIALLQLISVVEKEQVLKTNVWLQVVCKTHKVKN